MSEFILDLIFTPPLGEILFGFVLIYVTLAISSIIILIFKGPKDNEKFISLSAMIYYTLLFAIILMTILCR